MDSDTTSYVYKPLAYLRSIRLFNLQQGILGEPLECSLNVYGLDDLEQGITPDVGEGQRETTLTGRPGGSPEDGWMLTTRHDADYLLRGRQPLRQDPWHRSEGLHPSDCPGPRPTDTT